MMLLYKIKKFKPKTIYLILSLILSLFSFNQTLAFDKECGYLKLKTKYSSTNGEFDPTAERGFIIGHDVKVFVNESDQNKKQNSLEFGKLVQIVDPGSRSGNRIKVSNEYAPEEIIGWVERDNVLCRSKPLRDPTTKLWRRVFIQTTEKKVGESNDLREPVKLFQSSEGDCFDTGCGQITLYKWFFVFGERNGKVLLSEYPIVGEQSQQMAGWLDKTEGVAWNTASALRPSLTIPSGNNNDYLCLWDSEEAAVNKNNCNGKTPLGKIWFKFDQRLAIINETEKAWKIVLRGNNCTEDMDKCEENLLNGPNTNIVENIKNIDVMFVVDGTKSIAPVIQSIKGTEEKPGLIQQIRERLSSKLSQNINLRVGFRIYRDSQKGGKNDGVRKEENLSLRSASCDGTKTFRKFDKEFKKVKPGDRFKDTDLEENFFGGVLEGIRDLRSCKSHMKLLFVVGDHGYSCEAQKNKGFKRCVTTEKIVNEMFKNSKIPISPFFVQLPIEKDPQKITNQGRLDKAYSTYERQSKDILSFYAKKLFELSPNKKISEKEFTEEGIKRFLRLPRSDLSKLAAGELVQVLDSYVNPEFIFGAINRGRTGENWVDAFNTERERTNAPVLLAEAILAGICGENETNDQCEDDIIQKVSQVWVSKDDSEKVTKEILMTTEQLNDWKSIINTLEAVGTGIDGRSEAPSIITQRLADALGIEIDSSRSERNPNKTITLGELIQSQGGLPGGFESPLFNYSLEEIRSEEQMPLCAFNRFVKGTQSRKYILRELIGGTMYPSFEYESNDFFELRCKGKTSEENFNKALDIKIIKPDTVTWENLNSAGEIEEYKYTHSNLGDTFVWVPVEFLP